MQNFEKTKRNGIIQDPKEVVGLVLVGACTLRAQQSKRNSANNAGKWIELVK